MSNLWKKQNTERASLCILGNGYIFSMSNMCKKNEKRGWLSCNIFKIKQKGVLKNDKEIRTNK